MVLRNPEICYHLYILNHSYLISARFLLLSSHLHLRLLKSSFPLDLPTKTLYAFTDSLINATCPAHLSHLNLSFLIMLDEEYNACSSALCNVLHYTVILPLLSPDILLSILFSNNLNFYPFLMVRDQVSQP